MTPQELITKIREKVIEACPDVAGRNTSVTIPKPFSGLINYRDERIGIAEILRTVCDSMSVSISISETGLFKDGDDITGINWDLARDRLEDQSPEVLKFLWELLK